MRPYKHGLYVLIAQKSFVLQVTKKSGQKLTYQNSLNNTLFVDFFSNLGKAWQR